MNPSFDQLNEYTHYLESQVQKFTSFMLIQKKLNQKHLQVEQSINQIFRKVSKVQEKIKLIEVNQKDHFLELKKIRVEEDTFKTMELRLQNIERELSSILKLESSHSLDHVSQKGSVYQHSSPKSERNNQKNSEISLNFHEKYFKQVQKDFSSVFIKRQDVNSIVNQAKNDLDFRIKKLQIEIDKNKESFLKLTNHINTFSTNFSHQNIKKKQGRNENRVGTQSTKDLNMEPLNQQNIVTKKQLRKMQKKLENFFSQKLTEMATKNQNQIQGLTSQKALKFKKIQQKYEKMNLEQTNVRQSRSERKLKLLDRQYSSQKKISLFDNEILKERHINETLFNQRKKLKSKSRSNKEIPNGMLDSLNYQKEMRSSNSKSQVKKIVKKKSPQRMKRINVDYMMQ